MKKRLIVICVILMGVLLTAAVAQSIVKHQRARYTAMMLPFGNHAVAFLTDTLNLTDQQQSQIKSILAQERTQMQPLLSNARQVHQQVEAAALSDNFDANQVKTILEQNKDNLVNLAVEAARTQNEVYKILTPEQRTKLETLRARHQERMNKWMQEQNQQKNN
ncbi:MAG TPA: Spy/CpxP family protein refolding chaperone [Terriglobales bacterium]|jgi:Spy/CpxP family protein refolding chaperone|nr:Spy/CpxP family protein refolding chaperone [Terriglobales bacterium]